MIVGEAPGYYESKAGLPFVGKSGQLLQQVLTEANVEPHELFVTNVVKHRPPQNRDPLFSEINSCWHYLEQQIAIVKPNVILCVGTVPGHAIARQVGIRLKTWGLRGTKFRYKQTPVHITWHPAYILRNPEKLTYFTQDIKTAIIIARHL